MVGIELKVLEGNYNLTIRSNALLPFKIKPSSSHKDEIGY